MPRATPLRLSPRELEVLKLYDQGLLVKQVAATLGISLHTVRSHSRNIIIKAAAVSLRHAAYVYRQSRAQFI